MIPALPEPALKLHGKKKGKLTAESLDYYTAAQVEQACRDYHAAMLGELVAKTTCGAKDSHSAAIGRPIANAPAYTHSSSECSGVNDPLYPAAVDLVLSHKRGGISFVQRHLHIGYYRAACMLEAMTIQGVLRLLPSGGYALKGDV